MKSSLINLVSFKAGWAAVILAAAASMPELGLLAVAVVVAAHLARTPDARLESVLLLGAAAIGLVWESMLVGAGLLAYGSGQLLPGLAPYWIVAMWVLFATTLNVGMRWMRRSTLIAAAAGGIGGPLAFMAGERAGAVDFADPTVALAVIAIGWAVLLPMLVKLAERFDGHEPAFARVRI
jgi:hypothetical protein